MSHFFGLPRPKDFKDTDVMHALSLARRQQEVQLITHYQLEGAPSKHCNISLPLFTVLYQQSGLTHSGEQQLEENLSVPQTRTAPQPQRLVEDGRLRYDYYVFTDYGKDILEYYHLIFLAQEEGVEMVHEQGVRFSKSALFQSAAELPTADAPLLNEEFIPNEGGGSGVLQEQETLLRQTWGQVGKDLRLSRQRSEIELPGLYHERLDFSLTAREVEVSGSLYLLHKQEGAEVGFVPYVKVQAVGPRTVKLAQVLDDDLDVDLGLDEFIGVAIGQALGEEG